MAYSSLDDQKFISRDETKRSKLVIAQTLRRDKLCQCCGEIKSLEVHHIEPLCYGGEDSLNNTIVLCDLCHKHAPEEPDEFLEYQKRGGKRWDQILVESFHENALYESGRTIADWWHSMIEARLHLFEIRYRIVEGSPQPKTRAEIFLSAKEKREAVLSLLRQSPRTWFSSDDVSSVLPGVSKYVLSDLARKGLLVSGLIPTRTKRGEKLVRSYRFKRP